MGSIVTQRIMLELLEIARSKDALGKRRASAVQRIGQYKGDLASAHLEPDVASRLRDGLARNLEAAAGYRGDDADETIIFAAALEALTGVPGNALPARQR